MRLTKSSIEALVLPVGKNELYAWDDTLKGFGVKLNAGGSRNYLIQYRSRDGRTRRLVVGKVGTLTLDEARKHARALLSGVQIGIDPHAEKIAAKVRAVVTLSSVAEAYLLQAKGRLRSRSYEEVERHLVRTWRPLAGMPVDEIRRGHVAAQLNAIVTDGHRIKAVRARSALSAMFTWAMGEGLAESNPVIGTNRPADERARDRVLNDEELRAIWSACRDDTYGRIVRLLLLTGQRREEVGSLAAAELNLSVAVWTIPSDRTKNGLVHEVPLSRPALEILATQPPIAGRSLMFGHGVGAFSGWSNSKERLDKRIMASGNMMAPWRLHDLRRTVATGMANLRVLPHVIEAVLNHISGTKAGVAGIYNRATYAQEKRDALDLWATHVLALVPPE